MVLWLSSELQIKFAVLVDEDELYARTGSATINYSIFDLNPGKTRWACTYIHTSWWQLNQWPVMLLGLIYELQPHVCQHQDLSLFR